MKFALASSTPWNITLLEDLKKALPNTQWFYIDKKEQLTAAYLRQLEITKVFLPHWSHIIDEETLDAFDCVIFHMTDLPYGRGGSPLQNLILAGHTETKLSALKASKALDEGPVYLKKALSLEGKASEIFERAKPLVFSMILEIIQKELKPMAQSGTSTIFKRRKPNEGDISVLDNLNTVFDYIRMLDAPGYPPAFIETEEFRIEFSNAKKNENDNSLSANVRIVKK